MTEKVIDTLLDRIQKLTLENYANVRAFEDRIRNILNDKDLIQGYYNVVQEERDHLRMVERDLRQENKTLVECQMERDREIQDLNTRIKNLVEDKVALKEVIERVMKVRDNLSEQVNDLSGQVSSLKIQLSRKLAGEEDFGVPECFRHIGDAWKQK